MIDIAGPLNPHQPPAPAPSPEHSLLLLLGQMIAQAQRNSELAREANRRDSVAAIASRIYAARIVTGTLRHTAGDAVADAVELYRLVMDV